jgi:hypothetical protein
VGYSEGDHRRAQLKLRGLEDLEGLDLEAIRFGPKAPRAPRVRIERLDGPAPEGEDYAKFQLRLW